MGKHRGKGKEASHRHKLSKSARFENAWNETGDVESFDKDTRRGKVIILSLSPHISLFNF